MKPLQGLVSLSVIGIVAALGYYFISTRSFDSRLGVQEDRIDSVSRTSEDHAKALVEQRTTLTRVEDQVGEQGEDLKVLEIRVAAAESRLVAGEAKMKEKESEIRSLKESTDKDRVQLERLESDLAELKADHQRTLEQLAELRTTGQRTSEEVDRRLKELERRQGVTIPAP